MKSIKNNRISSWILSIIVFVLTVSVGFFVWANLEDLKVEEEWGSLNYSMWNDVVDEVIRIQEEFKDLKEEVDNK